MTGPEAAALWALCRESARVAVPGLQVLVCPCWRRRQLLLG